MRCLSRSDGTSSLSQWYWVILCSLGLSPLILLAYPTADWPPLIFTVVVALLFLVGATFIVDRPTPRFLTSADWIVLLLFGLVVQSSTAD
jgi:hypothetical protein